jgi:hypothetical protein
LDCLSFFGLAYHQLLGAVVYAIFCIFWVIPVAFAVSLANLATVKKYLPLLGVVTDAIVAFPIGMHGIEVYFFSDSKI